VVLRADDDALARTIEEQFAPNPPMIVTTRRAADGMAHSLADGVRALGDWTYVFVGLGDMPFVEVTTLRALRERMQTLCAGARPAIVQPTFEGRPGHPVGFSACFIEDIMALTGDRGARPLLERNRQHLHAVPVDDPGVLADVDTPRDVRSRPD
jgi:molybdenum cofactor cytidylyltransferase